MTGIAKIATIAYDRADGVSKTLDLLDLDTILFAGKIVRHFGVILQAGQNFDKAIAFC